MKRLAKDRVLPFLREMSEAAEVYCPQRSEAGDLMLLRLGEGNYSGEMGKTTYSAKAILFPQSEEILSFMGNRIRKTLDSTETLVFGVRPCEMRAIAFVDRFMARDNLVDPHYEARRRNMTCIVAACHEPPSPTCFCVDAGGAPYLEEGFDVQLFDTGSDYVAVPGSRKGEEVLESKHFEEGKDLHPEVVQEIKEKARNLQGVKPGTRKAIQVLQGERTKPSFWEDLALDCIQCGGCVYVCPTCTCFNAFDRSLEGGHKRYRTWDTCLYAGFTREASGHNPRPTPGSRLARRWEHKLKYDIINFKESGCVGCGRCSDACPTGLGAIEIIEELNRLEVC